MDEIDEYFDTLVYEEVLGEKLEEFMEEWKAKGYTEDEILEDKTIYDAIWEIADDYATKAGVEAGKEYREDSEAAEQARQNISSDDDESLE